MSVSQRVIVKGDTLGGWIPVPQEMFDATGVSEETILETKQWGKVVPLMRKIGDYVLEHYLANDPRKAFVMQWKSRYCTGINKKKKEAMISPTVGFIYILDSFKNHRGPTEEGRARGKWRVQMMRQIAAKATWKRTHTALSKLIHNPMNMSDSNPGKQLKKKIRAIQREPNVPWSTADYSNMGYPGADLSEVDFDAPLNAEAVEKTEVPLPQPPSFPAPDVPPAPDPLGEAIVNVIEKKKKEDVNKTDESGAPPPSPPPPPPTGRVDIPGAKQAHDAEGDYGEDSGDESDDGAPPAPSDEAPVITADGGYPDDGAPPSSAVPVPMEEAPLPPPPSPPPAPNLAVEELGEPPSSPPPPPPPPPTSEPLVEDKTIPGVTASEDPFLDETDISILFEDGAPPPPPPPPSASALVSQRMTELETEIEQLRKQIEEKAADESLLLVDREDLRADVERLNSLINEKNVELAKQKALMEQYEVEKATWDETKERLEANRTKLEQRIEDLKQAQEAQALAANEEIDNLTKRIQSLLEASEHYQADLNNALDSKSKLEKEKTELLSKNASLAQEISELTADDIAERSDLIERANQLEAQVGELNKRLEDNDNLIAGLKAESISLSKQIEQATKERDEFEQKMANMRDRHQQELDRLRDSMKAEYEGRMNVIIKERDELRTASIQNEVLRANLQKDIDNKNKLIQELQSEIRLTEVRVREEERKNHDKNIDARIVELEDQIREKQKRITELTAQNQELLNKIDSLETELTSITARNVELDQAVKDLSYKLAQQPTTEQVITLRAQLAENAKAAADAQRLAEIQLQEVLSAKALIEEQLTNANATYNTKLKELQAHWQGIAQDLNTQIADLKRQRKELITQKSDVDEALRTLRREQSEAGAVMDANKAKIVELQKKIADVSGENKQLQTAMEEIRQQNDALNAIYDHLRAITEQPGANDAQTVLGVVEKAMVASKESEQKIKDLNGELQTSTDKVKVIEAELDAKKTEIAALKEAFSQLTARMGAYDQLQDLTPGRTLSEVIQTLQDQLKAAQNAYQQLEQLYTTAVNERGSYAATAEQHLHEAELSAEQVSKLQLERTTLEKQIGELTTQNEIASKQYQDLNQQCAELENSQKQLQAQISALEIERDRLSNAQRAADIEHAETVKKIAAEHDAKIAELRAQLNQKMEEIAHLTAQLQEARKTIEEQNQKIIDLSREYDEIFKENVGIKQELANLRQLNNNLIANIEGYKDQIDELISEMTIRQKRRLTDASQPTSAVEGEVPEIAERSGEEATVAATPEESGETTMAEPTYAVSENPPAVVLTPQGQAVTIVDAKDEREITIYSFVFTGKDGRRRRVYLCVQFDEKNQPRKMAFFRKNGRFIPEDQFKHYGIPYNNYGHLQQDLLEASINNRLLQMKAEGDTNLVHREHNPHLIRQEYVKTQQFIDSNNKAAVNPDERQLSPEVNSIDNDSAESPDLFLNDPANLFPIIQDFNSPTRRMSYVALMLKLFDAIRNWLRTLPLEFQFRFLTDPNYVSAERLKRINERISGMSRLEEKISTILYDFRSNLTPGGVTANQLPKGFKMWLRSLTDLYQEGRVLNLHPKSIYHTLASLLLDYVLKPGTKSNLLTGFGYEHRLSTGGVVPIPYVPVNTPATGLHDYYGYGFNPFLKQLHNPLSYHTQDYSGYGYPY